MVKNPPKIIYSERFVLLAANGREKFNDFAVYYIVEKNIYSKEQLKHLASRTRLYDNHGNPSIDGVKGEVGVEFANGEICYDVFPKHQNQGIATEILSVLTTELAPFSKTNATFLRILEDNVASRKVSSKCGYVAVCKNEIDYLFYCLEKNFDKLNTIFAKEHIKTHFIKK